MTEYLMGKRIPSWREGQAKNITFILTEDCNLVCKYCYITGKNKKNKMTFEVAKKAIDFILGHPEDFPEKNVIIEFMGGEPLLEIDLLDQISDYFKTELYRLNHKWFGNYRFSMATNGLLYGTPKVQEYIRKNYSALSIGISIDGNKEKHDNARIKPDGSGSYDDVIKNVPLWLEQFPNAHPKTTYGPGDLIYLKDSVLSLFDLGVKEVAANVVFEEGWQENDDLILENQLIELADHFIDSGLWKDHNCTFFSERIGYPVDEELLIQNWCGAGRMLAIDYQGKFYPCTRFVGYSLNKREGYVIGDVENGYYYDKLRPFFALRLDKQSTDECINCQVASGCAWCSGLNYDDAKIPTLYERATYICKMHKARVRANDYFWNRLKEVTGVAREKEMCRKDHLYFILSNHSAQHCAYEPSTGSERKMDLHTFKQGLEFARNNFYTPVLLLPPEGLSKEEVALLKGQNVLQIYSQSSVEEYDRIKVYKNQSEAVEAGEISILLVDRDHLTGLSKMVQEIFQTVGRINLQLLEQNHLQNEDLKVYEEELGKIAEYLVKELAQGNYLELNVLTDAMHLDKMANCNAGVDSFALAPDGKLYICPAFYFDGTGPIVGDVQTGIDFNFKEFLTAEKSPVCSLCDVYHCRRCVYSNRERTNEFLIPGENQCVTSHVERKVGRQYLEKLAEKHLLEHLTSRTVDEIYPEVDYTDPLYKVMKMKKII